MLKHILVVILSLVTLLSAQEKLTLTQSINLTIENNSRIKISKAEFNKSLSARDEVVSMFYPKLSFAASYTRLSDVPDFEINVPIFPNPVKVQETVLNNYNIKLGFVQPLFTGFRLSSMKTAATLRSESAEYSYNAEANSVIFEVVKAYYLVVKAGATARLIDKYIAALDSHLADSKAFLDNGLITYNDYLKIELELSRLKLRKIDADNGLQLAKNQFKILIGLPSEMKISLDEENVTAPEEQWSLDELKSTALNNRLELKGIGKAEDAAREMISAKKSEYYPSVYLFGNFNYSNPNQRYMPVKEEFNESWDAGVSLQWELWNWGGTSARAEQAGYDQLIVSQNKKMMRDMIESEVLSAFLNYQSESQKVTVNKEAVNSAKENYRLMKERYQSQLATGSELIDAETMLLDAEINLFSSENDLKISSAAVKKAIGIKLY